MTPSSTPLIVFVTTCRGRLQHLKETLPKNIADNIDYPNCKFIILAYGDQDVVEYIKQVYPLLLHQGTLVLYSNPTATTFKMAHAKNMAHRLGILEGAEILVNLDADNFTGPGFARYVAAKFALSPDELFLWANRNQPSHLRYPKGCNGRIVISTNAFLKSGGYDEVSFSKWGPDDKDLHFRLRRLGMVACEIDRVYLDVILHNNKMRFKDYPETEVDADGEDFQKVSETATIVNYGHIGEGVVYRNFDLDKPITLGPIPTRIFGIGMHKTGTTSLHGALKLLGYDSAHWKSVRWAKNIWNEMKEGKSITVEKHYALSDLPITILYEQLDKAYPGSKFILTVRNEYRWLTSVRNHWSQWNHFRDTWKKEDNFVHKIHSAVYGQSDFSADVFLARYKKHNADVVAYFKDRPNDLLVMDMDKGAGWNELCGFLDQPIPDAPYPVAFVTPTIKILPESRNSQANSIVEMTLLQAESTKPKPGMPEGLETNIQHKTSEEVMIESRRDEIAQAIQEGKNVVYNKDHPYGLIVKEPKLLGYIISSVVVVLLVLVGFWLLTKKG